MQRRGSDASAEKVPFFELDVQLSVPSVRLSPTLEDVQASVNAAAASVLGCAKRLYDWGEADVAEADRFSFFEALGSDLGIIKTVLLLTGASYGTAVQASFVGHVFVDSFDLWWAGRRARIYHVAILSPNEVGLLNVTKTNLKFRVETGCHAGDFHHLETANIVLLRTVVSDGTDFGDRFVECRNAC